MLWYELVKSLIDKTERKAALELNLVANRILQYFLLKRHHLLHIFVNDEINTILVIRIYTICNSKQQQFFYTKISWSTVSKASFRSLKTTKLKKFRSIFIHLLIHMNQLFVQSIKADAVG